MHSWSADGKAQIMNKFFRLEFYMAMKVFLSIQKTELEEARETSFS